MFRRYLVTNLQFSTLIAREMASRALAPDMPAPKPDLRDRHV